MPREIMCPEDNVPRQTMCPGDNLPGRQHAPRDNMPRRHCAPEGNVPRKAMCPEGKNSQRKYALEKMCPGDNVPQRQCALEDTALVWSLLVGFGTFRHLSYIQNKMDKDISCFILILIGFKYISMSRFKCLLDKLLTQYFRTSSGSILKMAISKEYSVNLVL